MDGSKWTVQKGESGRSRTIVDGLLSQSGRSWVKEDDMSFSIKVERIPDFQNPTELYLVIRLKVDGPLGLI